MDWRFLFPHIALGTSTPLNPAQCHLSLSIMTLCHGQSRAEGKGGPLSQLPFPFPTQVAVSESTNVSKFEIGNLAKESAKTMVTMT